MQPAQSRGRVRRLSLATDGGASNGPAAARKGAAALPKGDASPAQKKSRGKRMSILSGDLGGDAGFTCDANSITFYDGVQIDDGNARLQNATQTAEATLGGISPPRWLTIGAASRAGHDGVGRKINQDAYVVSPHFNGRADQFVFGVFDGHGTEGHYVSRFITRKLPGVLMDLMPRGNDDGPLTEQVHGQAVRSALMKAEEELFRSQIDSTLSGTTAVMALMRGKDLLLAHCGDSRAVLGRRKGKRIVAVGLTEDHKPEDPEEKKRIEAMGGLCKQMYDPDCDEFIGPVRVWSKHFDYRGPGIAMSRSIGDQVAAEVGVISDPELGVCTIDTKQDALMIIASDGVWEFIDNQEAVDIASRHLDDPRAAAMALCTESLQRWHQEEEVVDDITVVVLQFKNEAEMEPMEVGTAAGATDTRV